MIQPADILLRRTDIRHRHAGHLRRHDLPLRRVVIHEHQTVRQNIQLFGDRCDIPALRLPVRLDHDEIIGL